MRKIPLLTTLAAGIGAGALAPGSPATASAPAATKGTERISIVSTSISAPAASLIARGAFTAGGKFIFSNTGGTVKLPDGSFKVTTASNGKTIADRATSLASHTY